MINFTSIKIINNKLLKMKKLIPALALGLFVSCSPTVQYIGKQYNPTQNVDVFLDTKDIKKNYMVIGKIDGISGILGSSYDEIQNKIVQTAQQKGADGVILYNMEKRVIGTTGSANTHRQWLNTSTTMSTSNVTEDVLHADFIKYED